jgi:hypothetical protein
VVRGDRSQCHQVRVTLISKPFTNNNIEYSDI